MERSTGTRPDTPTTGRVAIALAVAAVVMLVVFAVADVESAIWLLVGALGLGAAIAGWRAGGLRSRGLVFAATVVGVVVAILVVVWGIVGG